MTWIPRTCLAFMAAIIGSSSAFAPAHRVAIPSFSPKQCSRGKGMRMAFDSNHKSKQEGFDFASMRVDGLPAVVLVRPSLDRNIGACARNMLNFGLTDIRLVEPKCDHLSEGALTLASGAGDVLRQARVYGSVGDAVGDMTRVYATTARLRGETAKEYMDLRTAASDAISVGKSEGGKACVIFGPESSGLTNDDLLQADVLVQIPTNPYFSSLNLAQAVALVGYECYASVHTAPLQSLGKSTAKSQDVDASKEELDNLASRLERNLESANFQPDPDMRLSLFGKLRDLLWRSRPSLKEAKLLHGVLTCLGSSSSSSSSSSK